ncbi:MAG TPA: TolC family protein, partial [Thermoleophilia bacterium]|nr:TolC family protein [Thermoleophilia bacterium]
MRRRVALAILALLSTAGLRAEDAASVPLSLTEAVSRALSASARLAQLSSLERAADAALRGARAQRLPQLDLTASYSRNSDVPELAIISPGPPPSRLVVFPNIPDNYRARGALSQPLYTGGRIRETIAAADGQHAAAGLERETGVQDL